MAASLRSVDSYDRLTPAQRRLMVGTILSAHAAAIWGLLQIREIREAAVQMAPMIVSLVAPAQPPEVVPPPPPPAAPVSQRTPLPRIVTAAPKPTPAPVPFVVAAPPPEAPEPPAPPVIAAAPAAKAAPPAPPALPPAPKIIPASAVQYLEPLALEYPRVSKRLGETGRVLVRVFIDEAGSARNAQINRSSGHARLDEAAVAAVQKARFKPYTENGQAVAGWAFVPIDFELEK